MSFVRDILWIVGASVALFGVHQIYAPLTYVVGGSLILGYAVVWSMKASK